MATESYLMAVGGYSNRNRNEQYEAPSYPDWHEVRAIITKHLDACLKAIEADLEKQSPTLGEDCFDTNADRNDLIPGLGDIIEDGFGDNFRREVDKWS